MPPREFIDIALQVLGRHLVVDADEASLQQCPEAFNTVRMRLVAHILTHGVVHCLVRPVNPLIEDGADKNDCERNAAKRLVNDLRREHPHLKAIIVEDALASNGPHINHLKNKGFRYILGAKPGDHERLFRWFDASETKESWKVRDKKTGTVHHYEWDIGLPLNDANFHLKVNMREIQGDEQER